MSPLAIASIVFVCVFGSALMKISSAPLRNALAHLGQ